MVSGTWRVCVFIGGGVGAGFGVDGPDFDDAQGWVCFGGGEDWFGVVCAVAVCWDGGIHNKVRFLERAAHGRIFALWCGDGVWDRGCGDEGVDALFHACMESRREGAGVGASLEFCDCGGRSGEGGRVLDGGDEE